MTTSLQVETHCAACGGPMVTIRRIRRYSLEPDSEPLCRRCIDEMLEQSHPEWRDPREEQRGSTCNAGCGWCGACS